MDQDYYGGYSTVNLGPYPNNTTDSLLSAMDAMREIKERHRKWVEESRETMPVCPKCGKVVGISDDGNKFTMCSTMIEELRRRVPNGSDVAKSYGYLRGMEILQVNCLEEGTCPYFLGEPLIFEYTDEEALWAIKNTMYWQCKIGE